MMKGLVLGTPMISFKINTAATGILVISSIFSGCAIMPNRNVLSLNKTIELDEYMYLDERGYRDYTSADTTTFVVDSEQILRKEGYIR